MPIPVDFPKGSPPIVPNDEDVEYHILEGESGHCADCGRPETSLDVNSQGELEMVKTAIRAGTENQIPIYLRDMRQWIYKYFSELKP